MNINTDGFGTLFADVSQSGGDPNVQVISTTTTNAVPVQIFQHLCLSNSSTTFRVTLIAVRNATAAVVGKFVREFTVKRVGVNNPMLLQDLVPSPDYHEDAGLEATSGVDGLNAVMTVTGIAATLVWRGRVEIV